MTGATGFPESASGARIRAARRPDIVRRLGTDVGHERVRLAIATFLGPSRAIVNFSFWLRDVRARRTGARDAARAGALHL